MQWSDIYEDGRVSCYHGVYGQPVTPAQKVAAFDLDGTLVVQRSPGRLPRGAEDWQFLNDSVRPVLQQVHAQGYSVVIFTNQGYTGPYLALVMPRIQSICEALDVPLHVFAAVVNDYNRKPEPGMWYNFVEHANANVQPDLQSSFFVGDAAGRPGDHSSADRDFARRIGLPFRTPGDFFPNAR